MDVKAFSSILTKQEDASGSTFIENVKVLGFKISLGDATGTDIENEPLQNLNSCKPLSFNWIDSNTNETLATSQSASQNTTNVYRLRVPRTPMADESDLPDQDDAVSKGNLKIIFADNW